MPSMAQNPGRCSTPFPQGGGGAVDWPEIELPGTRRTPRRFVWGDDGWEKEDPGSDERSLIFPLAANFEDENRSDDPLPPSPPSPPGGGCGVVPRMGLDPDVLEGNAFLPLRNDVDDGMDDGGWAKCFLCVPPLGTEASATCCVVFVCGSGMIFRDGRHLASPDDGGGNVRFEGRQFSISSDREGRDRWIIGNRKSKPQSSSPSTWQWAIGNGQLG